MPKSFTCPRGKSLLVDVIPLDDPIVRSAITADVYVYEIGCLVTASRRQANLVEKSFTLQYPLYMQFIVVRWAFYSTFISSFLDELRLVCHINF